MLCCYVTCWNMSAAVAPRQRCWLHLIEGKKNGVGFCSYADLKKKQERCVRQRANRQTSAAVRRCLSLSLLLSSPAEVMFSSGLIGCPMQTVSHGCITALYPADPLGRTWDVFIWALPHYGSIWQTHTHFLPLPIYTPPLPNTHPLFV